jgi:hypothetical protein
MNEYTEVRVVPGAVTDMTVSTAPALAVSPSALPTTTEYVPASATEALRMVRLLEAEPDALASSVR